MPTEEMMKIVSDIARLNPGTVLILTGGEPLAHKDIYELCSKASSLGLMVVLGTNGTLLTPAVAKRLKECGVAGVGVSIDSLDEKLHDEFRGSPGALKASISGLMAAKEAGIEIQVQTTPIRANIAELPKIADWAHGIGAHAFNIFFLVCTGRGQTMTDITPQEYEKVLIWASSVQDKYPGMLVRPKCAPHFKRVLHAEDENHPLLSTYISACRAGTQYCRIDPRGVVTPCPYMDVPAGDLKKSEFGEVWNNSPVFQKYRVPVYEGKCGLCRYRLLCGGCRARAYANNQGEMGEDAYCAYVPQGQEEAIENIDTISKYGGGSEITLKWSPEAEVMIGKIPFFARSIVRLAVERHARARGIELITMETMKACSPSGRFKRPSSTPK
jgi:radical SAM protein with 4Fe4S-binding SPASM domain